MNHDRAFRRLVFVAALMAMLTYSVSAEAILLGVVAIALAILGWTVTERRGDRAVPRALIALAITLSIGWAILSGLRVGLNVEQFCQFTIAVLVIKTFDRRTSPDLGQFIMLALFLAIGSVLTSNTIWMALCLAPTLAVCVAAGVAYQFHLARAGARKGGGVIDAAPARIPGLARTIALGWGIAGVMSVAVFLLFPRGLGADAFGQWGNAGVGMVTGFNSRVDLGEAGLISTSAVPVLDLTVRSADGTVLGAPNETYYLRGAVLDRYDRGSWTSTPSDDPSHRLPGGVNMSIVAGGSGPGSASVAPRARGPQVTLDVMVRNVTNDSYHVFTTWRPRRIQFETQAAVRVNSITGVIRRSGQPGRLAYQVVCDPVDAVSAVPPEAQRWPVTFDSPPIRDLARQIAESAGLDPDPTTRPIEDDARLAAVIERWFASGFGYTLDIARPPPGRDPIEWFLLEHKQGHCEYFASAMVALCRSLGINSRVVTGYVATEFNDATRHYIVRESNAHAWVEVEVVPGRHVLREGAQGEPSRHEVTPGQWQTRDPTPSGEFRRIHRPDPTFASQIRGVFDAINYAWINSIVAFDDRTRTSIVSAMRLDTASLDAWAEEAGRRIRFGGSALIARALENALIASLSTAALGIALVMGIPMLRRALGPRLRALWLRLSTPRGGDPALRLIQAGAYPRLLRALARLGNPKPDWQPPLQHATTLDDTAVAQPAARVVAALYAVRFGQHPLEPAHRTQIETDLADLERRSTVGGQRPRASPIAPMT